MTLAAAAATLDAILTEQDIPGALVCADGTVRRADADPFAGADGEAAFAGRAVLAGNGRVLIPSSYPARLKRLMGRYRISDAPGVLFAQ